MAEENISEEKFQEVLDQMIKEGLIEGNDTDGYHITKKGIAKRERDKRETYGIMGVI